MIYVFLADGFEEIEALTPVDILRRAGKKVCTVGVTGKQVTGSHQITVEADVEISKVDFREIEALILPGGIPGADHLRACQPLCDLLQAENKKGTLICAICAAPYVLGELGILQGKQATCYPGYEEKLLGASHKEAQAVTSQNVITGRGAGAAGEFAFAIVEKLCGKDTVEKLKQGMCYAK